MLQLTVQEGHADEVAQLMADMTVYLRAEIAKGEGYRYGKLVRDGNMFYAWEECVLTVRSVFRDEGG